MAKALSVGGTLCIQDVSKGGDLGSFQCEEAITAALVVFSLLVFCVAEELPALKTLIVGGEACPPELVQRWSSQRCMMNAYGPTEITVCAIAARLSEGHETVPIGRPIPNSRAYVLDDRQELVPIGVCGELYLAGVGLARGYL